MTRPAGSGAGVAYARSGQLLASSQPGSMRDVALMFMETHYAPFGDLLGTIRTGEPAAESFYGQPFFG
jgi:hypothetical protein